MPKHFEVIEDKHFENFESRTCIASIASLRMDIVVVPKDERTFYHVYGIGSRVKDADKMFETFAAAKEYFNDTV